MNILSDIKVLLGDDWQRFEYFFKATLQSEVALLNTVNNYLQEHKGKLLRPALTLLSAKMIGNCNHDAVVAATVIELMHTATLLHDDVVDNADRRRGAASVKSVWRSNVAVLTGDYWLSQAIRLAVTKEQLPMLPWLSRCMEAMSEGELWQMEKVQQLDITEADYYNIIGKKTAVLLATSMVVGALAAGADSVVVQYMYDTGYAMGMAFQIRDDIFDYEKNNLSGKTAGNDIVEKKITLPLWYALQQVESKERKHILKQVENAAKKSRSTGRIIDFVHQQGGIEYAEKVMAQYSAKAIGLLNDRPESPYKTAFVTLAQFMTSRRT